MALPVVIKKKDGTYGCCLDFRNINEATLFDVEPMPQPEDIFAKTSKDTYFPKLDFCKGYHQNQNGGQRQGENDIYYSRWKLPLYLNAMWYG